jgi:hypothetical protein
MPSQMSWLARCFKKARIRVVATASGDEMPPEVEVVVVTTEPEESPLCSLCRLALRELSKRWSPTSHSDEQYRTKIRLEYRAQLGCHLCSLFLHLIRKAELEVLQHEHQLLCTPGWGRNAAEICLEVQTQPDVMRKNFFLSGPHRYRLIGRLVGTSDPLDLKKFFSVNSK